MRRTVVALPALMVLAACGGKPAVDPPPPHSSAPSASSSPAPPVMPALAKQHTKAGAEAFVSYFWNVVNYSQQTLDTAALGSITSSTCGGCNGVKEAISETQAARARFVGGANHVQHIAARIELDPGGKPAAFVVLTVKADAETIDYQGPTEDRSFGAQTHEARMVLLATPAGWAVDRLDPR